MRILWVKADKLLPVENGGNIRTYHILRYLAEHHQLTFYSYYGGATDKDYERELQQRLPGSVAFVTGKSELSGISRGLDYLAHLNSQPPYAVSRFASFQVQDKLRCWFRERRFDVAVCDFLDAAVNFPGRLNIPCVLFQHNVESEIWRRHAATAGNPLKKLMYDMEFRKMLRYEQVEVRKFHHVVAVSKSDRTLMTQWVDDDRVTVVPTESQIWRSIVPTYLFPILRRLLHLLEQWIGSPTLTAWNTSPAKCGPQSRQKCRKQGSGSWAAILTGA